MQTVRKARLTTLAALTLLMVAAPVRAELPELFYKASGVDVSFPAINGRPAETRRYLYHPILGAYTIGPDAYMKDFGPTEKLFMESLLPKGDPYLNGNIIPNASGPIIPLDQNRIQIDEGMNEAAPQAFKNRDRQKPWYSVFDEQVCSSDFENAWTYTSKVIAPEVEVFAVRLPNQKFTTEALFIGARKGNFPILVPTAFGQVLLKDGAKALICRSADSLRVFNLTGRRHSVMVKLVSGKIVAIGPGTELVAAKSKEQLQAVALDGIARRGLSQAFAAGDNLIAVNEFWPSSVLKATGFHHVIAESGAKREQKFCKSVLKSSAVLAVMKGGGGYRTGPEQLAALKHPAREATDKSTENHPAIDVNKNTKAQTVSSSESAAVAKKKGLMRFNRQQAKAKTEPAHATLPKTAEKLPLKTTKQQAKTQVVSSNESDSIQEDRMPVSTKGNKLAQYSSKVRNYLHSSTKVIHFGKEKTESAATTQSTQQ
jgi:hypothetical protein